MDTRDRAPVYRLLREWVAWFGAGADAQDGRDLHRRSAALLREIDAALAVLDDLRHRPPGQGR